MVTRGSESPRKKHLSLLLWIKQGTVEWIWGLPSFRLTCKREFDKLINVRLLPAPGAQRSPSQEDRKRWILPIQDFLSAPKQMQSLKDPLSSYKLNSSLIFSLTYPTVVCVPPSAFHTAQFWSTSVPVNCLNHQLNLKCLQKLKAGALWQ